MHARNFDGALQDITSVINASRLNDPTAAKRLAQVLALIHNTPPPPPPVVFPISAGLDMRASLSQGALMQIQQNSRLGDNNYQGSPWHQKPVSSRAPWIPPSGPRRDGEGVEDETQGIISIKESHDRILVEVTLLVSGFIIGPGGVSIRAIQTITGTAIRSWSQPLPSRNGKKVRVFTIEGPLNAKCLALEFMKAAIIRYKYLAEGACWGESAQQRQTIEGVDFYYSPPPKSAAPRAAGLKAFPSQVVLPGEFAPRPEKFPWNQYGGGDLMMTNQLSEEI